MIPCSSADPVTSSPGSISFSSLENLLLCFPSLPPFGRENPRQLRSTLQRLAGVSRHSQKNRPLYVHSSLPWQVFLVFSACSIALVCCHLRVSGPGSFCLPFCFFISFDSPTRFFNKVVPIDVNTWLFFSCLLCSRRQLNCPFKALLIC